jgi:hypothetical protein
LLSVTLFFLNLFQEDKLREKALELARREAALEQREQGIGISSVEGAPKEIIIDKNKPNWPICYPFLKHSIREGNFFQDLIF